VLGVRFPEEIVRQLVQAAEARLRGLHRASALDQFFFKVLLAPAQRRFRAPAARGAQAHSEPDQCEGDEARQVDEAADQRVARRDQQR